MAPRYNVNLEVEGPDGVQSTSPYAIIGVARYANPLTYDPTNRASQTTDPNFAFEERDPARLVIVNDIVSLTIQSAKDAHTMQLQATLVDSGTKYLNEILPGDWLVANIVYDRNAAKEVATKMAKGEAINNWQHGFKFIGRVTGLRKTVKWDPQTGTPSSAYVLSATAFGELDTFLLYYPELANNQKIPPQFSFFGTLINEVMTGDHTEKTGIDINNIIPVLIRVIFGAGAWSKAPGVPDLGPASPNLAYIVPQSVSGWLGLSGAKTFADILKLLIGIQKYDVRKAWSSTRDSEFPEEYFQPDKQDVNKGAYRTGIPLIGNFPIVVPPAQGSAWSIITSYLNTPVNEIVVTLRPFKDGRVYPYMVVRQVPFTTDAGKDAQVKAYEPLGLDLKSGGSPTMAGLDFSRSLQVTRYMELPRWVISPSMAHSMDVGRSDQIRMNMCFVHGSGPGVPMNPELQFVKAPPIKDDLDILRNGVRPYMPSINCLLQDANLGPDNWRDMLADQVMGLHLSMNGTLTTSGIRAPIAVGDNLEFERIVYHIETVNHSFRNDQNGNRAFQTTMTLSRGLYDSPTGTSEEGDAGWKKTTRSEEFPNITETNDERPSVATTSDKGDL